VAVSINQSGKSRVSSQCTESQCQLHGGLSHYKRLSRAKSMFRVGQPLVIKVRSPGTTRLIGPILVVLVKLVKKSIFSSIGYRLGGLNIHYEPLF